MANKTVLFFNYYFRYSTVYTTAPVFSLVLDVDVRDDIALRYPELYKDLVKGRILSYKTFFIWLLVSIYQGRLKSYNTLYKLMFYDNLCTMIIYVIIEYYINYVDNKV